MFLGLAKNLEIKIKIDSLKLRLNGTHHWRYIREKSMWFGTKLKKDKNKTMQFVLVF